MGPRTMRTMRTQISSMSREQPKWEGTATELLRELVTISSENESICRDKDWPKTTNALSNRLRRAAPFLREEGLEITFTREGRDRTRMIHIYAASDKQQRSPTYEPKIDEARPHEEAEVILEPAEMKAIVDEPRSAPLQKVADTSSAPSASSADSSCVPAAVVSKPPGIAVQRTGNFIPKGRRITWPLNQRVIGRPERAK